MTTTTNLPCRVGINYKSELISLTVLLDVGREIDFHPAIFQDVPAYILDQVKKNLTAGGNSTIELTAGELELLTALHSKCNVRPVGYRNSVYGRRW